MIPVPLLTLQTWAGSANGRASLLTSPSVPAVCFSRESLRGQDRLPQTQFPKVHGAWSRSKGLVTQLGAAACLDAGTRVAFIP